MKKFILPRKLKKKLKKRMWLYPEDEEGDSLMAAPTESEEHFQAYKQGLLRNIFDSANSRAKTKANKEKYNKEIFVTDKILEQYIANIIREDLRISSFNILVEAKNTPRAIIAYYNFINAYLLYEKGEETGNICCMAIDWAKDLLKSKKKR